MDGFKDFCRNYEVNVLNDSKRRARYNPPQFFTDPTRADVFVREHMTYETEQVYTVEIPEGRLQALVEMEQRFFKWQKHSPGEIDMFETLMNKEREEAYIRSTNIAVQKAYEQYSMLLNLTGYRRKF
jgi:hypothetical protein